MSKLSYIFIITIVTFLAGCQVKPVDIDFDKLTRPDKPNYYLACPEDECNIRPDIITPCYNENVRNLKQTLLTYIKEQSRYTLLSQSEYQLQYIQRSLIFRFPDYITFQFYEYSKNESSVAILSYAKYGYYDFGVNKDRVNAMVKYINLKIAECE